MAVVSRGVGVAGAGRAKRQERKAGASEAADTIRGGGGSRCEAGRRDGAKAKGGSRGARVRGCEAGAVRRKAERNGQDESKAGADKAGRRAPREDPDFWPKTPWFTQQRAHGKQSGRS